MFSLEKKNLGLFVKGTHMRHTSAVTARAVRRSRT